MPLRFYTLPPLSVQYPFILVNANHPEEGLRYIRRNRKAIKAVLIDSGIEIFRDPKVKEYPEGPRGRILKQVRLYNRVKSLVPGAHILVTIPDYCDDYIPGNLWISQEFTNIERTFQNVVWALDEFPEIPWLVPIQGHNKKPRSIAKSIYLLEEAGILSDRKYYAVANLCVEKSQEIIVETLKIARKALPGKFIHAFGLDMRAIAKAYHYRLLSSTDTQLFMRQGMKLWKEGMVMRAIKRAGLRGILDSTDSTAWTRPCGYATKYYLRPQGRPNASRKSERDSVVYFWSWLYTLTHKYKVELEGLARKTIEKRFLETLEWALGKKAELCKHPTLL